MSIESNREPKYQRKPMPEKVEYFLIISHEECVDLMERDVLCPYCGFRLHRVFSDAQGHLRVKCQKCKGTAIVNLAYFYRSKGLGKFKSRLQNKNEY